MKTRTLLAILLALVIGAGCTPVFIVKSTIHGPVTVAPTTTVTANGNGIPLPSAPPAAPKK